MPKNAFQECNHTPKTCFPENVLGQNTLSDCLSACKRIQLEPLSFAMGQLELGEAKLDTTPESDTKLIGYELRFNEFVSYSG